MQELRKSGKTKELEAVSKAFEVFFDRVTKRETGSSFASLNWVGETYYSLGSGFDEDGAPPSSKAKVYFQKATTAYQRMLEVAEKDPKYQDQPESLLGIRLRLADCYRRSGNFDEAIKTLVTVLCAKSRCCSPPRCKPPKSIRPRGDRPQGLCPGDHRQQSRARTARTRSGAGPKSRKSSRRR